MKLISKGWQYSVYDTDNGWVLKRYNTFFTAWCVMMTDSLTHLTPPIICFYRRYREGKEAASRSLKFIGQTTLDKKIFGHPRILSEYSYEQEKAESLASVFKRVSHEEGKNVIDAFVDFNLFLFKHSLIEKNFNIASNFGLNSEGEIILIDLGEICTTESEIQERITLRAWSTPDVLSGVPAKLRTYFIESLDAAFSVGRRF
jgi:hypothetical protein